MFTASPLISSISLARNRYRGLKFLNQVPWKIGGAVLFFIKAPSPMLTVIRAPVFKIAPRTNARKSKTNRRLFLMVCHSYKSFFVIVAFSLMSNMARNYVPKSISTMKTLNYNYIRNYSLISVKEYLWFMFD